MRWEIFKSGKKGEEIEESIDLANRKNHHLYNELNESNDDHPYYTIDMYDDFRCLLCAFIATVMHSNDEEKKLSA